MEPALTSDLTIIPPPSLQPVFQDKATGFNHGPNPLEEMCFLIRTDAQHATKSIRAKLIAEAGLTDWDARKLLKAAYTKWSRAVSEALIDCTDYKLFGIETPSDVRVHLHKASHLADHTVDNAKELVRQSGENPDFCLYVSLDEMVHVRDNQSGEIAFSRLFSTDGWEELDYVARPGHDPLPTQLNTIKEQLKAMKINGHKVPIVLLEDNVRRAKMINWIIDKMNDAGIFEYGELIGVSTGFCSACDREKSKVVHNGKSVPIVAVHDYSEKVVDVKTIRDLMFDGLVVSSGGEHTRLPALFMNVGKIFKIEPSRLTEFTLRVANSNIQFCEDIFQATGRRLRLDWLEGGTAISEVTGLDLKTDFSNVMKHFFTARFERPFVPTSALTPG